MTSCYSCVHIVVECIQDCLVHLAFATVGIKTTKIVPMLTILRGTDIIALSVLTFAVLETA